MTTTPDDEDEAWLPSGPLSSPVIWFTVKQASKMKSEKVDVKTMTEIDEAYRCLCNMDLGVNRNWCLNSIRIVNETRSAFVVAFDGSIRQRPVRSPGNGCNWTGNGGNRCVGFKKAARRHNDAATSPPPPPPQALVQLGEATS
ncbi:hypothetical protein L2E82_20097 [Cichorium intybus]|uniref:Uncharacterized protein n=1 Tax=Cichorium intybus TaxID=13427 RepID=A0ACB9DS17_CICIN|nr:hypothetical protein L2E82_20097 [Cichorium intybus]